MYHVVIFYPMKRLNEDQFTTNDGRVVPVIRTIIFNIPAGLQDEAAELVYERGYTKTEVGLEGIRSLSDKEGLWRRRRDFAVGQNPLKSEEEATAG